MAWYGMLVQCGLVRLCACYGIRYWFDSRYYTDCTVPSRCLPGTGGTGALLWGTQLHSLSDEDIRRARMDFGAEVST